MIKQGITALLALALFSGCSINHPVAIDYDEHLENYESETALPETAFAADYRIDPETENHRYEFRAGSVGVAHLWIVEFGKILDKTLQADYVQSAFGRLEKAAESPGNNHPVIDFTLDSYEFNDYRAQTTLTITVTDEGREVFDKTYESEGSVEAGRMWGGGPFAMKKATLRSTKRTIDIILEQFIEDIESGGLAD